MTDESENVSGLREAIGARAARLAHALRTHNWFAVLIEILIVTTGVLMGIEVSNWNQARLDAETGASLTKQLRLNMSFEAFRQNASMRYNAEVIADADAVLADVMGEARLSDEQLLIRGYRATQYIFITPPRHYDEIQASGKSDLIEDRQLWDDVSISANTDLLARNVEVGVNSGYRRLFRESVPVKVQRALSRDCGDKGFAGETKDAQRSLILNADCTLAISPSEARLAAQALRNAPGLVPALRIHIVNRDELNKYIASASRYLEKDYWLTKAQTNALKADLARSRGRQP